MDWHEGINYRIFFFSPELSLWNTRTSTLALTALPLKCCAEILSLMFAPPTLALTQRREPVRLPWKPGWLGTLPGPSGTPSSPLLFSVYMPARERNTTVNKHTHRHERNARIWALNLHFAPGQCHVNNFQPHASTQNTYKTRNSWASRPV